MPDGNEGIHNSGADLSKVEFKPFNAEASSGAGGGEGAQGGAGDSGNNGGQQNNAGQGGAGEGGQQSQQNQNQQQQNNSGDAGGASGDGSQAGAAKPIEDVELIKIINERGGIQINKLDEIKAWNEERATLKAKVEELSKPKEPEFPNEKAKALYDYAKNFPGKELAAAKSFLNIAELDLKTADPKRLQFEAFALKYPDYPREDAKAIFDAQYEKEYGDGSSIATDPLLRFKHDEATKESRMSIESAVKNFKEAKLPESNPNPPGQLPKEQMEQITRTIDGTLKEFKGSAINLPEYKTKTGETVPSGVLNLEMKPEEAAKFREYLITPESFMREIIGKFKEPSGFNWNGYVNHMHQLVNGSRAHADIHSQGIEKGMILMLDKIKNSQGGNQQQQASSDGQSQQKKSASQQYQESRKPVEA